LMRFTRLAISSLSVLGLGCVQTIYTVGPKCPVWSEEAESELGMVLETGRVPHLEEAIGRQEAFCQALEPESGEELCIGWSCWLRRIF